jgi:hypothetical protein
VRSYGGGGDACGLPGDFSRAVALADGGRGEEGHDKNRRDGKEQDTGTQAAVGIAGAEPRCGQSRHAR